MPKTPPLPVSPSERRELESRVRSRSLRADDVRRARLILMLTDGESYDSIQETLGCSSAYVARWKDRFLREGLGGVYSRHQGRKVQTRTPRMEARILDWKRRKPTAGSTHWSTRKLSKI